MPFKQRPYATLITWPLAASSGHFRGLSDFIVCAAESTEQQCDSDPNQLDTMARHQRTLVNHISAVLEPKEVESLLSKLCDQLGFCLPPDDKLRIQSSPPADIDAFVHAVFTAEGLDPLSAETQLYHQVRHAVAMAFQNHSGHHDDV
jgi:hypothetical protein